MKRRTRIAAIAAVLLAPPIGMVAWYGATKASAGNDGLNGVLGKLGYYEVTPPSRLYGPGTIITVEKLSTGALDLHLACKVNGDALSSLWQKSMTLDQRMVTNIEQQFELRSQRVERSDSSCQRQEHQGRRRLFAGRQCPDNG